MTCKFLKLSVYGTDVALQSIGLLCPGHIHVSWQRGVLVQECSVVVVCRQVLGLLGLADI